MEKQIQSNGNIVSVETRRTSSNSKKFVFKNVTGLSNKTLQITKID